MPNWCKNRVDFYSENKEDLKKVLDIFSDKESVFGQIIPEPDWKNIPLAEKDQQQYSFSSKRGEVGELPVESGEKFKGLHFASTGIQDDRWYDWRNYNWGTKWDVSQSVEIEEERYEDELESFQANFDTAWSPPEEVYHALRDMFPDMSISWFYDEPGMQVAGYL